MDGIRRIAGLVLPSNNTILEPELARIFPAGVAAISSRIRATGADAGALLEMSSTATRALDELAATAARVMLYACLSTSLVRGASWDDEFSAEIQGRTGRPLVTAAAATVRAIQAVGARRIGLVTPYPEDIDRLLPPFLAHHCIDIAARASLRISDIHEVGRREPAEVAALARSLQGDFDALVILATDLRTLEAIAPLEYDLGVPVVTTNQALAWAALDALEVGEPISGFGALLAHRPLAGSVAEARGRN